MFVVWGYWASWLFGWAYESIQNCSKPKLFVVGDKDEFTTMAQYEYRMNSLQGSVNFIKVIEGKNHFEIESVIFDSTVIGWMDAFIKSYVL
jgi:hypothetical protein